MSRSRHFSQPTSTRSGAEDPIRRPDPTVMTRTIEIPRERIPESTHLQIMVNPSIASCIRESLPYMIEYPYGCTEQTLSSFLPNLLVTRAMTQLKIAPTERLNALGVSTTLVVNYEMPLTKDKQPGLPSLPSLISAPFAPSIGSNLN